MHDSTDVHRSLRRWFGIVLPEPWDVQYSRDENMSRPSAVVQPATPAMNTGSAYVRDLSRDFEAFVYPEGTEGDPAKSRDEAEAVATLIDRAMSQGVRVGDPAGKLQYSYTMRLPVFDYEEVPWDQAQPDGAEPYDHYPVSNWNVEVRLDPEDDTLFTVLVQMRIRWRRDGDTRRFRGKLLERVDVEYAGDELPDPDPVEP